MASLRDDESETPRPFSLGSMALSDEPGRLGLAQSELQNSATEPGDFDSNLDEAISLMRMILINEQHSPQIMKFREDVVQTISQLVEQQTEQLDAQEDVKTADAVPLETQLKKLELERLNYLLRQYYRIRIKKMEKQILFIFKDSSVYDHLSPQEQRFAVGYSDLVEDHFKKSFLSLLPERVQVMDNDGKVEHASGPNLDVFVFCKVKNSLGRVAIGEDATDDALDLNQGDILCIRYRSIQELLQNEDVELI